MCNTLEVVSIELSPVTMLETWHALLNNIFLSGSDQLTGPQVIFRRFVRMCDLWDMVI